MIVRSFFGAVFAAGLAWPVLADTGIDTIAAIKGIGASSRLAKDYTTWQTSGVTPARILARLKAYPAEQDRFCAYLKSEDSDLDDLILFEPALRHGDHGLDTTCQAALLARLDRIELQQPRAAQPDCAENADVIGTARTIEVDFTGGPAYGTLRHGRALDLRDKELVLTFEGGPVAGRTTAILETLDRHCAKATFFAVGRSAERHSGVLAAIHNKGHTIAHHTYSRGYLNRMPLERAQWEITQGAAVIQATLDQAIVPLTGAWPAKVAPFFRFPGFLSTPELKAFTQANDIAEFLVDIPTEDWRRISPDEVYRNAIENAETYRKGIVVMHDIQPRTINTLPRILTEWHRRGFKIVHIVPKGWQRRAD